MQPGEVSCTIALWVCASRFPTTVPTFHAFTIQLHDLSPVWRPHLSDLNDAWGQGAEGRPLCYLLEHATAQKTLYRKEHINSTFTQGNFSQSLATSCVAQCRDWILRDGEPSKGEKSEKRHCCTCTRPTDLVQLHVLTMKF